MVGGTIADIWLPHELVFRGVRPLVIFSYPAQAKSSDVNLFSCRHRWYRSWPCCSWLSRNEPAPPVAVDPMDTRGVRYAVHAFF